MVLLRKPIAPIDRRPRARWSGESSTLTATFCEAGRLPTWMISTPRGCTGASTPPMCACTAQPSVVRWICGLRNNSRPAHGPALSTGRADHAHGGSRSDGGLRQEPLLGSAGAQRQDRRGTGQSGINHHPLQRPHHRRARRGGETAQFDGVAGTRRRPLENEFATGNFTPALVADALHARSCLPPVGKL